MIKRKILMFLLVLSILSSVAGSAFAETDPQKDSDVIRVIEVATSYLEASAHARYFYEPWDAKQFTIDSISKDEQMTLLKSLANYNAFRAAQEIVPYDEASIATGSLLSLTDNLLLHREEVAFYAHLNEIEGITYEYFSPSYDVVDSNIDGDLATINLYETLDFQYSDCDEPSMTLTHYFVSLVRHDCDWLVMAVESDDLFYQTYRESGFDLKAEIADVDSAYKQNEEIETEVPNEPQEGTMQQATLSTSNTDRTYIPKNAVNYALTYSTSSDEGKNKPEYKNEKFYWVNASCQMFVSQCIWAGFGGSNSESDINAKIGMDTSGSYLWWSTKNGYNNTAFDDSKEERADLSYNSWVLCRQFKKYVEGVSASSTESGIVCDLHEVANDSKDMVGKSGLTANDLIGAALQVKGTSNGNPVQYGHAIFVNNATGTTRDTVYFTSYNNCHKNIKLSTFFNVGSTEYEKIYVIVPRYLRGGEGAATNYLYGDLQNALVKGESGVTVTLYGRAHSAVSTLTMDVYAPGDSNAAYTFTASYNKEVSGRVLFDQVGDWTVVVKSAGLRSFTYQVRVVE